MPGFPTSIERAQPKTDTQVHIHVHVQNVSLYHSSNMYKVQSNRLTPAINFSNHFIRMPTQLAIEHASLYCIYIQY